MTTGTTLTSCPTSDDPAAHARLCAVAAEPAASQPMLCPTDLNPDSWRVEVTARLERYRTRRKPRTPRYPSLLLPFDALESWSRATASGSVATARAEQDFKFKTKDEPTPVEAPSSTEARQPSSHHTSEQERQPYSEHASELSANVIEFPRSAAIPVFHPSDLADPVFDRHRPRIVEVPEILPPPPALGGMLIEPAYQEPVDRRAADLPAASPSASLGQRALAALVDGIVLAMALAAVVAIFLRLNAGLIHGLKLSVISVHGPLPVLAGALAVVTVLLWASYEFLFVVYTGSTPGLRATRLRLAGFDGSPLNRSSRRWRVLASFLSAFSAGLGYLWCAFDQEGLCWHDRITRTHVQSVKQAE